MKFTIALLLVITTQLASAASVKFYKSEGKSKVYFTVLNSAYFDNIVYDEDDKELTLWHVNGKGYDFIVNTIEEANEIIIKLLDKNDKSLVTLTES